MPLEHERSFSADSPVGRYWLLNCAGFHVKGLRGGPAIVEEVGLESGDVDVLAVRRRVGLGGRILVPVHRVESLRPWDETIVLASARRRAGDRPRVQTHELTRRLAPAARTSARALRNGIATLWRLLRVLGALLLGIAVAIRTQAPRAGRLLVDVLRAYAFEARRAWRAEREAIEAWRASRHERPEEPADEGPLTRAGADEVDARRTGRGVRRR
jgi:hypothetical protein